ncbi:FG-GAP-like repeat-containing protein [Streptomyces sp. NPDC059256]|uniref:FG-GAP and VCBS repeat-containing protein n=1 Tax=Streptomyces sp. NPDC059256 TaxID=3346794 RepID=UPI0036AE1348
MSKNLRAAVAIALSVALAGGFISLTAAAASAATSPAKHADDYNGDGFRDYATAESLAGEVTVTYGTASGPGTQKRTFTQNTAGIPGSVEENEAFGMSLAPADYNRDGYADLAVGDPLQKVGKRDRQGMVVILWGSKSGLTGKVSTLRNDSPVSGQWFGESLATGDFNGDGKADLAVSQPTAVTVYHGGFSTSGATGKVTGFGVTGGNTQMEQASSLVAGKVDKDKSTDLYVLGRGRSKGRDTSAAWFIRGGSTLKPGKTETYNALGSWYRPAAAIADFDKNGYGDLAVSDPMYNKEAGSVFVLRGGSTGPSTWYRLSQSSAGVATAPAPFEWFGFALSAGDVNHDGHPDLAVGVPGEKVGSAQLAGGAHVLYGGKQGLSGAGSRWITRGTSGIPGSITAYDFFGGELRLRDFDRDGDSDVLVGAQDKPSVLIPSAGRQGLATASARELPLEPVFPQ